MEGWKVVVLVFGAFLGSGALCVGGYFLYICMFIKSTTEGNAYSFPAKHRHEERGIDL